MPDAELDRCTEILSPEVFTSIVTGDVSAQTAGAFLISLYL